MNSMKDGVILKSGKKIEADIIISATGLVLENFGGMEILLDGVPIDISDTATYKSMMHSDIPNFLNTFGYINASWTLKADLTSKFLTRLINFMKKNSYQSCRPVIPEDMQLTDEWLVNFHQDTFKELGIYFQNKVIKNHGLILKTI